MEIVSSQWSQSTHAVVFPNSKLTLMFRVLMSFPSEYPAQRSKKDSDGVDVGVAGSVNLLQNVTLSSQPIASLDWSPDKQGLCVCSGFDQSVRVLIVTKLNVA